jgi:hypothetical protein
MWPRCSAVRARWRAAAGQRVASGIRAHILAGRRIPRPTQPPGVP